MLKQYIEFFYPGFFVSESSVKEVMDRTPPSKLPEGAYGYRFFARQEITRNGEVLIGQEKKYSPTTFIGKALTLKEVKALCDGDYEILISNMECNGWKRVVRTNYGQFFPLEKRDLVKGKTPSRTRANWAES